MEFSNAISNKSSCSMCGMHFKDKETVVKIYGFSKWNNVKNFHPMCLLDFILNGLGRTENKTVNEIMKELEIRYIEKMIKA